MRGCYRGRLLPATGPIIHGGMSPSRFRAAVVVALLTGLVALFLRYESARHEITGEVAVLGPLWADEARLAAWLETLGPVDGAAVHGGFLVHAVEGADGEALAALLDRLGASAAAMGV